MIRPQLTNIFKQKSGTARTIHLASPVKGWNTRDPIADMDPLCAVQLTNWYPRAGELLLRGGYQSYATGVGGTGIRTLFQYASGTATKLYAASDTGIYDVTSPGAVGAAAAVLTAGTGSAVNFTNSIGTCYTIFMNGIDTPKMFDGAAWTVPAITGSGLVPANGVAPWTSKRRIWFVERATSNAWYLAIDAIQGVASKYPLGALFTRGGYLVAGASWTLDAGDGADDYSVFVSSEGQVAIFRGTDPSSATSWSLIGVYIVGKPIGRNCLFPFGGDVGLITEVGVFPLSKAILSSVINYKDALTDPILPSMRAAASAYGGNLGWQGILYPAQNALLINVPVQQLAANGAGLSVQYVMNTITGAWTQFTNWNAGAFSLFNGTLFFGDANGVVYKAWDGAILSDAGSDITGFCQQAYNYLGGRGMLKRISALRVMLSADDTFETRYGIDADFSSGVGVNSLSTTIPRAPSSSSTAFWDVASWDTTAWSTTLQRYRLWRALSGKPGFALSLLLQVSTTLANVTWSGADLVIADGGIM